MLKSSGKAQKIIDHMNTPLILVRYLGHMDKILGLATAFHWGCSNFHPPAWNISVRLSPHLSFSASTQPCALEDEYGSKVASEV